MNLFNSIALLIFSAVNIKANIFRKLASLTPTVPGIGSDETAINSIAYTDIIWNILSPDKPKALYTHTGIK